MLALGETFTYADGLSLTVSDVRSETDFVGDPVTKVSVTVANNTQEVQEFGLFDTVIDATYGPNGQKAEWAILSSQALDGSVLPGRSMKRDVRLRR